MPFGIFSALPTRHFIRSVQTSFLRRLMLTRAIRSIGMTFRIQYVPDFEVHLSGWFPAGIVRQEPSNSSIELEAENLHTKQEKWSDDDLHSDRRPDDVWVSGRALPTAEQKRTITRLALTTV